MKKEPVLIVIAGPTAVGKTALSINLAKELQIEILSADSRQFYKETIIGTAAPSMEERRGVKHHFIGHLSISDYYNVSMYEQDALEKINQLFQDKQYVILTGGSGLYIDAVCNGIDSLPDIDEKLRQDLKDRLESEGLDFLLNDLQKLDKQYYEIVDKQNPNRVLRALEVCIQTGQTYTSLRTQKKKKRDFQILKICLTLPRDILNERINARTDSMMASGFLQEAQTLFPYKELNALNTVGYKELFDYLSEKPLNPLKGTSEIADNQFSPLGGGGDYQQFQVSQNERLEMSIEKIKTNTRRYAKRQMTWFKKDSDYVFFEPNQYEEIIKYIYNFNGMNTIDI